MSFRKTALITGINGQVGSFLAEHLLKNDYEVHGTIRRHSEKETEAGRINHIRDKLNLHYADICDPISINNIVYDSVPNEIYHLAAQSDVRISFDQPLYTFDTIVKGTINVLQATRDLSCDTKVYVAGTSEMFGNSGASIQNEKTPMCPVSPYGVAKLAAYNIAKYYRDGCDMFVSNGIMFNTESWRRGKNFVTAKIIDGAIKISKGESNKLVLGNIDAKRDWSDARDSVDAIYKILQHDEPDDFVFASGVTRSIRDFIEVVFDRLGILDWQKYVTVNSTEFLRPNELHSLCGDSTKIKRELGWEQKIPFEQMIEDMIYGS